MRTLNALLLSILTVVSAGTAGAYAQDKGTAKAATFRFLSGQDMFYIACSGNEAELSRLHSFVDEYRTAIVSGKMPVYVDGYCASLPTERENRRTAFVRANRVKSELITSKGLAEENFVTRNHTSDYNGHKDIVVVTVYIPVPKEVQCTGAERERKPESTGEKIENESETVVNRNKEPVKEEQQATISIADTSRIKKSDSQTALEKPQIDILPDKAAPRYLAVKTNLATWAGTMLNVAAEVQVGSHLSLELPVIWSPWHINHRHSVRTLAIQPEARYWLSRPGDGHFFGLHAHTAWYNVRWKDDRYQDARRPLLGAGLSYGYLLPLGDRWAGEFILGAGYANMRYNTYYNIDNGARIDTRTKNYWGITRIRISLVYRFTANK